jgi:small subunit ribosomal protein S8
MTNDLISDMLTRIRNATLVRHTSVLIPYSRLNKNILSVLKKEGYIKDFEIIETQKLKKTIKAYLRYKGWWIKKPLFTNLQRVSTPGQRIFSGYKHFTEKISLLKYKQGTAIISTSSGIMTHTKAMSLKKGGEIICYIG